MRIELRRRRDEVYAHYVKEYSAHPATSNGVRRKAVSGAVLELADIIAEAVDQSADRFELGVAYRYLGDALSDWGKLEGGERCWQSAVNAYQRATAIWQDADASVERAKLEFNYANALVQLAQGTSARLLEVACERYRQAGIGFRAFGLLNYALQADARLATTQSQLALARRHSSVKGALNRLEAAAESLPGADAFGREHCAAVYDRIAKEIPALDLASAAAEARDALAEEMGSRAHRDPDMLQCFASIAEKLNDLTQLTTQNQKGEHADPFVAAALAMMRGKLEADRNAGHVTRTNGDSIEKVLNVAGTISHQGSASLADISKNATLFNNLKLDVAALAREPGWTKKHPPGSRAARVAKLLELLHEQAIVEMAQQLQPGGESERARQIFADICELGSGIESATWSSASMDVIEERAWRCAIAMQEFARRDHLTVARPIHPFIPTSARGRTLFLSGGEDLLVAAGALARSDTSLRLHTTARHGDTGQERFSQLREASLAVFDLPNPIAGCPDSAGAQIYYELGVALALGKVIIIVSRAGYTLPFDIELKPILFGADQQRNIPILGDAVQAALGTVVWGGRHGDGADFGERALAALDRHCNGRLSSGTYAVHRRLAQECKEDGVALRGVLEQIAGSLGAAAPALLLPAWSPGRIQPRAAPTCFHVMPFGLRWSDHARDMVRLAAHARGVTYLRGDESKAQRIVPAIFQDILAAEAVLIDITNRNCNVALELGLVHALGRPHRIVAQCEPGSPRLVPAMHHSFPSLAKLRITGYGPEPGFQGLAQAVAELFEEIEPSNQIKSST